MENKLLLLFDRKQKKRNLREGLSKNKRVFYKSKTDVRVLD